MNPEQPNPIVPSQPPAPVVASPPPVSPTPIQSPPAPVQPVPPSSPSKRFPRWLKIILIILVVAVVLFVVIFAVVGQTTRAAVKVSDKFIADMQHNNESDAYSLTTDTFRKATSNADLKLIFTQISPKIQGKAKITERAINKETSQSAQAAVVYSIDTSDGTKYIRVILQDDKSWQVLNFRASDSRLDTASAD